MSWNGSGTYVLAAAYYPEVNATVIDAVRYNGLMADIATGLNNTLAKDGQVTATGNIPMGTFKLTGLGAGTAAGNSLRYEQMNGHVSYPTVALHATTMDIGASYAELINATGSGVTVTAFPNAGAVGTRRTLIFSGINTLTHSANLVLFTGANLTTASGDTATLVYTAAGVWTMTGYQKKNGSAVVGLFGDGAVATPSIGFASTAGLGFYKYAADTIGLAASSNLIAYFSLASTVLAGTASCTLSFGGTYAFGSSVTLACSGAGTAAITTAASTTVSTGTISLTTGAHTNGGTTGDIRIRSGNGTGAGSKGGNVVLQSGSGATAQGDIWLYAGNSSNPAVASGLGNIYLLGGTNGSTAGGNLELIGGMGGTTPGTITAWTTADGVNAREKIELLGTGMKLSGSTDLTLDVQHLLIDNTAGSPTISTGGGSGGTVAGSDVAMQFTAGTGSPTSVTINFADTWSTAPIAVATGTQSGQIIHVASISTTQIQISSSSAFSSGTKVNIFCFALV